MRETLTEDRLVKFINKCGNPLTEEKLIQFINKCGNRPTEQQLTVIIGEAAKRQNKDDKKLSNVVRNLLGNYWQSYLKAQVDCSGPICDVVKKQGFASNRAKPIGLFLGNDELVELQDDSKTLAALRADPGTDDPIEVRHKSFIESFWWNAEEHDPYHLYKPEDESIGIVRSNEDRKKVIMSVAELLAVSSLPDPQYEPRLEYIAEKYVEVADNL